MNKQEIEKAISYWSEFKAEIKDLRKQNPKVDWDEQEKAVDLAISALEQQLTNGWMPVSERLPEENGHYLVTYHEWSKGEYLPKFDFTCVKILRFYRGEFKMPICCDDKIEQDIGREVLAWRELPEIWRNNKELATDNNVVTKSGKDNNAKDVALSPEEAQELKAERDYWKVEALKWCAKLGEIRLWIGEQN